MMKWMLYILLLVGCSCRWFAQPDPDRKMDVGLRRAVAAGDTLIHFSGKCRQTISEAMERRMEDAEIRLLSVIGRHFTGRGDAETVLKLVEMDFVETLQSGQKLKFKTRQTDQ